MTKLFLLCPFHALVFLLRESVLLFCEIMNVRVGCSFLLLAWCRSSLYDWSARYHSTEEDTRGSSSGGAAFKHRVPSRDRQGPTTSPVQTTHRQTDTYTVYRGGNDASWSAPFPMKVCFNAGIKEVGLLGSLLVTAAVIGAWKPAWRGEHQPKLHGLHEL